MKKYLSYIITVLVLFLSFYFYKNNFSCKRISCISMEGLKEFKLKDVFQENSHAFRGYYEKGETLIKAETIYGLSPADADQYVNAGVAKIKGVYTDALVPYPGIASQQTGCDEKLKPTFKKIKTNTEVSYFTGYLNSNLTFGTCIESQITHRGITAFFYCSNSKQGYQIEIIAPKKVFEKNPDTFKKMVESISCL